MADNNAWRKKEAKQKAGPSGQKEKQRKDAESSERIKNGSRRSGWRKAQKARVQPSQVQEPKTQEEESTMYVGVLHVSSRAEWTCHMSECAKPYHALRECDFFLSLSARERTRRVRNLRLCEGCLTYGHSTRARSCPFRKEDEGLCSVRNAEKVTTACCMMAEAGEASTPRVKKGDKRHPATVAYRSGTPCS